MSAQRACSVAIGTASRACPEADAAGAAIVPAMARTAVAVTAMPQCTFMEIPSRMDGCRAAGRAGRAGCYPARRVRSGSAGVGPVRVQDPGEDLGPVQPVGEVEAGALPVHAEGHDSGDEPGALEEDRAAGVAVAAAALALGRVRGGLEVVRGDRALVLHQVRLR